MNECCWQTVLFETKQPDSLVKVIDYGLAEKFRGFAQSAHDTVGSRVFTAPEVLRYVGHGMQVCG
jgi:serine/threonine protein kinase